MRASAWFSVGLGLAGLTLGAGCASKPAAPAASAATVRLSPDNVVTASAGTISSGPSVSGQLTAARAATLRAQVGGELVALPFDRGQAVKSGAEVARISSRDLDANVESAGIAVKSAESALALATTEEQRTTTLVTGGALATRDLDQAKNAVSGAEAQVAAARARQKSIAQQLQDTSLKAPFSGVVSERPASLGDIVAPGTVILTIVDPSSMRLEALVPSDQLANLRVGSKVHFTIRGVAGDFTGAIERQSAVADPATRQVSIFVSLPNTSGKLVAGLFAQGRVESSVRQGIVVPLAAVDETGAIPAVTRVRDGKAERVNVTLGERQPDTETVELTAGVSAGDVLVTGSAKGMTNGTPVEIVTSKR